MPGPLQEDGRMMLAIADKPWLKRIVDACRTAKLPLRKLLPETFLPALLPGTWTLVWDGCSGFLRSGIAGGMALDCGDSQNAPLALRLCLASAQTAQKIELRFLQHIVPALRVFPQWPALKATLVEGSTWDWQRAPIAKDTLNLLWGDLAPRARISEYWPHLRPAALILLAALGVETLGSNLEWLMLAHEKKSLSQQMERSFRTAFGEAGTLVNAPLQMRRKLAELRHSAGLPDDGDFLALLDVASPALAALPQGSVRGLHYEAGRLDADIRLARGGDFQDLAKKMHNKGLSVQIGEIREVANGAEARLALLPGGAR